MSVAPSNLGTQSVGEAAEVAEGVYQLKVPVPFPLVFVSAYLVEGYDGWTIIDTGYDYLKGRKVWEKGTRQVGLDLKRDVERIVVTHFHPDHLGLARWLQEWSGPPVYMLEDGIQHSREVWNDPDHASFAEHLIGGGMDQALATRAAAQMRAKLSLPGEILPLQKGEKIELGAGVARVLHAPGHGPLFHDFDGRVDELLLHHEERLDLMHRTLGDEPRTPFAVSREVFRYSLSLYERCFALAETLAHLEYLVSEGRAERVEDGHVAFREA